MKMFLILLLAPGISFAAGGGEPLTVIALGDGGENTSSLRGCGNYATNMHTGQHDGGKFQLLLFLGDNFYPTGLNVPVDDVEKKITTVLEPFKLPMEELGRPNVHAIAGNHDYYSLFAIETSTFFGLVKIEEAPMGLSDRGNQRAARIPTWTYHSGMPSEVVYPLEPGSPDSAQFIFYDSALPLRSPPGHWSPALDSLRRILQADRHRSGIVWRIFCAHHPFASAGEHGGYSYWNDESNTLEYLTPCDKDSNGVSWLKNSFDPEDLCTDRYRAFVDSVRGAVRSSGVKVHLALGGHDHSLQLLTIPAAYPGDPFPSIQVISGAASQPTKVRYPAPPALYTSAKTKIQDKSESLPGFVQLRFGKDRIRVVFFNANNGDMIDMGGETREFFIGRDGTLIP